MLREQDFESIRRDPRSEVKATFRLLSGLTKGKYTVEVTNLSKRGAFVKSRHLPSLGETVTYYVVDKYGAEKFGGNARVAWLKSRASQNERGFGLELFTEIDDTLLDSLRDL